MDHPPVAAVICILKVNMHCRECEQRVIRTLRKVKGVHSVVVDGDSGKAKVTGNMDPFELIKALKKRGKIAEILQYRDALPVPSPPLPPPPLPPTRGDNQNQPNERASHQSLTDQNHVIAETAHLQNPSNIDKMKQEDLTHSKRLKVTIKDSGNGSGPKNNINTGGVQPHHHNGSGARGGSSSVASSSSNQEPPMTGGEGGGPSTEQTSNSLTYTYHETLANEHRDGCILM